ncbi:hypothetical protein OS493_022316 [Desmophyllum pertusum]|uniref:Uncharacterized protein n=1 Tax=Desmophyllum pertusum TaxID=174260 RepID=A0A9X0A0U6_9CNID|nr:hypothetical protein OS493_022316 [Desmophyllum pertusum]
MLANFRVYFLLFLLCLFARKAISQAGVNNNDLEDLYKAFAADLSYFNREYQNLDSDALLGLRVAEGYIHRIIEDAGKIKLDPKNHNNMTDLLNRVSGVVKKIVPLVQKNDPLFYPALNSLWTYYKPYQVLEMEVVAERQESKPDDRERYSRCVGEIVGSKSSHSEPCTISDECWKTMMTKGAPNSMLYYQALFIILGEAAGCRDKLTSRMKASGDKLTTHLEHICTLAYYSNAWTQFVEGGDPEDLMLILKLSFSCGLLGYHDLLTRQGLANAVGWQLNSGCYGDPSRMGEDRQSETEAGTAKRELKSTYLKDGCISDVTGAGLGLLAIYMRWILDPPPQIQPVNLVKSTQEDAKTLSVYMFVLLFLTAAFLFAARRIILEMVKTCHAILFGQRKTLDPLTEVER